MTMHGHDPDLAVSIKLSEIQAVAEALEQAQRDRVNLDHFERLDAAQVEREKSGRDFYQSTTGKKERRFLTWAEHIGQTSPGKALSRIQEGQLMQRW